MDKKCLSCDDLLPRTTEFFSRHKGSADGWYQHCKICKSIRARISRSRHAEDLRKQKAAYRSRYSNVIQQRKAKYYHENREEILKKQLSRKWYLKHRERILSEKKHKYYGNRELYAKKCSIYYQKYGHKIRTQSVITTARRRSREKGLPDLMTENIWNKALKYWNYSCAVCGKTQDLLTTIAQDHWIPVSAPNCPGTIATNILPLCHGSGGCNNKKHTRNPVEWIIDRFGKVKGRKKLEEIAKFFKFMSSDTPQS